MNASNSPVNAASPILCEQIGALKHEIVKMQDAAFGIMESVARIYREPTKEPPTDINNLDRQPDHFVDDLGICIQRMNATNERLKLISTRLQSIV